MSPTTGVYSTSFISLNSSESSDHSLLDMGVILPDGNVGRVGLCKSVARICHRGGDGAIGGRLESATCPAPTLLRSLRWITAGPRRAPVQEKLRACDGGSAVCSSSRR